ncbi:MAG: hypothetical protein J6X28_02235 [Bacilli bacterium]|nr:hypothetical protein [Bacilli bacterium]
MNRSKTINIIIVLLLFVSFNLLMLGTICYALEDNIENFKYSDTSEYTSITNGLSLIQDLPIEFNIQNQYFSGFDSLSNEVRESIIMAYLLKNQKYTYTCGDGSDLCIDKENLTKEDILKIFHTATKFTSTNISLYLDDYGDHNMSSTNNSTYYRMVLDDNNQHYRKYTKFLKYKEQGDSYIFYVYEGYYKGNCTKGETLKLYDFLSGEEVYIDSCNGNNEFENMPKDEFEKLQLYKYELKKNDEGEFYLYGYNPVNY